MKPWQIISELEKDNSRLAKEEIISRHLVDEIFKEGITMALSPYVTFGVKQVPIKTESKESSVGLSWEDFKSLADQLSSRALTGHAARDAVEAAMLKSLTTQWNDWYRRILIKDLRCGVSEKTVNKVAKDLGLKYRVPVFTCQLAHDSANHESKVAGKKMIEVKLDGVRVLTLVYPNGTVEQYSRNGKELHNFEHIKTQLSAVAGSFTKPYVLDGEVMSSSFQDLMKQVHRKSNVTANDAVLHLFDIIPLEEFQAGVLAVKQSERTAWLTQWYENNINLLPNVTVLDHAVIDLDTDEGQKLFSMYNKSAVENGYEGIMIKDLDAPYECKRSTAWLKLKPFIEVSLEIKSVEEGTGRNEGRLGAFVCEGVDDSRNISVNVGSGFSDNDRDSFWQSRDTIIGRIVEVRADAITQNQDGTYSLRFPRFKTFRGFENGEKL